MGPHFRTTNSFSKNPLITFQFQGYSSSSPFLQWTSCAPFIAVVTLYSALLLLLFSIKKQNKHLFSSAHDVRLSAKSVPLSTHPLLLCEHFHPGTRYAQIIDLELPSRVGGGGVKTGQRHRGATSSLFLLEKEAERGYGRRIWPTSDYQRLAD